MLAKELGTKESLLNFCCDLSDSAEEARAMTGLKLLSAVMLKLPCSNCHQSPCQSGSPITSTDQIRVGTKVAPNPNNSGVFDQIVDMAKWSQRGETEIVSVGVGTVKVAAGPFGHYKLQTTNYNIISKGQSLFCFICKN